MAAKRPVYLNLAIPFSVYVVDRAVASSRGYEETVQLLQQPLIQVILLLLVWALVHHFLAGIRYLFLDFDIGIDKASSNMTAWTVLLTEVCIIGVYIWSVWL